tara:strand:+ start:116 stop:754 length:639 start_codon:yes stop_codon:yes gene_type:complete
MECPKCGADMQVRTNRSNGDRFWGCSEFPDCRGTQPLAGSSSTGRNRPTDPDANPQLEICTDRLPKTLSPSRAVDFLQCPRKFYEKVVTRRVVFQATEASLRGTLTHHALDHIFDHPASKRTPDNAVPYVRSHWTEAVTNETCVVARSTSQGSSVSAPLPNLPPSDDMKTQIARHDTLRDSSRLSLHNSTVSKPSQNLPPRISQTLGSVGGH